MSETERNAIVNPAEGLIIFNTTSGCPNYYHNSTWFPWCGNCSPPAAPLPGSNSPVCVGSTLNLTASAIVGATYSWTGPNGFSSTSQNPSITNAGLAAAGTYNVAATVNGCTSNYAATIVAVNSLPNSSFTYTPTSPNISQAVTFSPVSTGLTYAWTFQNGSPATSTAQNPVVTWSTSGTFSVSLTVTGGGNCSSTSASNITISNCGGTGSQTFSYTGAAQTFTVPVCITQITIEAYGAQGSQGTQGNHNGSLPGTNGGVGGLGGKASGTLTVSPGQIINIYVGGQAGWNGGGASGTGSGAPGGIGGGASDVRIGGNALSNRVIAAAGGGGGGGGGLTQSCSPGIPSDGGAGSGGGSSLDGSTGTSGGGGPGVGVGGYYNGNGGSGGSGNQSGTAGGTGTTGQGGNGGSTTYPVPPYAAGVTGCGGGGGGGYTGGGGGGGAGYNGGCGAPGGGGAGGTSYTGGVTNGATQGSVRSGNGQVIISW